MTSLEIICCLGWLLAFAAAFYLNVVCRALKRAAGQRGLWLRENLRTSAQLDFLRGHCRIVYYPEDGSYPIEHAPHAGKDGFDDILKAAGKGA
jgi:hypothetical protein